jgi:quercetin dioxygenase-like cupin family protein
MRILWLSSLLLALVVVSSAQDAPVPVDQEPHHKVVLKNEFVEVLHVTVAPGERTLYHAHSHDRAGVQLAASSETQQKWGDAEGPAQPNKPGDFFVATLPASGPLLHRVHNVGATPFDVIDIEFLRRPEQPSAAMAGPVAGENPSARAYHWALAPGAKSPEHTHHRPYLIVAATPMQLKMSSPDGQSVTHEVKAGDFHWVDAQVTHVLANDGTTAGEIIEFELK